MEPTYLAEGSRAELARLKAVLDAAGVPSDIGPAPETCATGTCTRYDWLTVDRDDLERARRAISRHWQGE